MVKLMSAHMNATGQDGYIVYAQLQMGTTLCLDSSASPKPQDWKDVRKPKLHTTNRILKEVHVTCIYKPEDACDEPKQTILMQPIQVFHCGLVVNWCWESQYKSQSDSVSLTSARLHSSLLLILLLFALPVSAFSFLLSSPGWFLSSKIYKSDFSTLNRTTHTYSTGFHNTALSKKSQIKVSDMESTLNKDLHKMCHQCEREEKFNGWKH